MNIIVNKKILSISAIIVFSIVLWGSVSLSYYYTTTITVPLKITNLPDGFIVGSATEKEVTINLRGEGWKLLSLFWGSKPEFKIPIGTRYDGETYYLKDAIKENNWLDNNIQVFDISPTKMSFGIERIREKRIKIYPDVSLSFKQDYILGSDIAISPESILVFGTRNKLSGIDSLPTIKKYYSDLESSVDEQIEIQPIDGLSYESNYCSLNFDVQKVADKSFENLEVEITNTPPSRELLLFPNKISLILRGGINILGKLENEEIKASVDFRKVLQDTTGSVAPSLTIPKFLKVVEVKPEFLKYIIKKY
ncbi:MAG: hypothetical protein C4539_00465 [Ignavibacteriales bacterium]|nr:MAG: hypothetical protein C4539_00465 [Ignavibacteriales bacterium]